MKRRLKQIVANILGWQVRRLRKRHEFKLIVVAGSIGKTSTKISIAEVLSKSLNVRFQDGNYNDIISVPLIFFNQSMPSLLNPIAWLIIFIKNEVKILRNYPFDVVVVEAGTDGPGQMMRFSKYIKADIGVLTSISLEHMVFFDSADAVAAEELEIFSLAEKIIVNADLVDQKYLEGKKFEDYSLKSKDSKYSAQNSNNKFLVNKDGSELLSFKPAPSRPENYSQLAAVATADQLGIDKAHILSGLSTLKPINGRMNILEGINGSIIIDDTYNASPDATKAALDYLYSFDKKQRIALLGNMNELGKFSKAAHREIGQYCDSQKLKVVVTLGDDANEYIATEAKNNGCTVESYESPYQAGEIIRKILNEDTVVLIKGSQNGVFAEEAIKQILANPSDTAKLVRQSKHWMKIKKKQFKDFNG